jgi:hypothetical protein
MEINSFAPKANWKEITLFLKELTKEHNQLPEWVRTKAGYLLDEKSPKKYTAKYIFEKAVVFFKIKDSHLFFKDYRYYHVMEVKNIIRYVMHLVGINLNEIADFFGMHRTTSYRILKAVKNQCVVDNQFQKKVSDFLIFCEI